MPVSLPRADVTCVGAPPVSVSPIPAVSHGSSTTASPWAQQTPHVRTAQSGAGSATGALQEGQELAKVPLLANLPYKITREMNSVGIYF